MTPHSDSWGITQVAGNFYLLIDDAPTKNLITSKWLPNPDAGIKVSSFCNKSTRYYKFSVDNPDMTSIYSWHIKYPNGRGWATFSYGNERSFQVVTAGTYTVYLRKDNLGFHPSNFGTITAAKDVYLSPNCSTPCYSCLVGQKSNINIQKEKDKDYEKYITDETTYSDVTPNDLEHDEDIEYENKFSILPNPTNNYFNISFISTSLDEYKIEGFNMQGKQIFDFSQKLDLGEVLEKKISTNDMVNGMYIFILKKKGSGEIISTSKLVVSK